MVIDNTNRTCQIKKIKNKTGLQIDVLWLFYMVWNKQAIKRLSPETFHTFPVRQSLTFHWGLVCTIITWPTTLTALKDRTRFVYGDGSLDRSKQQKPRNRVGTARAELTVGRLHFTGAEQLPVNVKLMSRSLGECVTSWNRSARYGNQRFVVVTFTTWSIYWKLLWIFYSINLWGGYEELVSYLLLITLWTVQLQPNQQVLHLFHLELVFFLYFSWNH